MEETDKLDPADLIVKAKVKTLIKEAGMNASAEIWKELGHVMTRTVKQAIRRAESNGRKTVKAQDV